MQRWFFLEESSNAERRRVKTDAGGDAVSEAESATSVAPREWLFRVRVHSLHPRESVYVAGNVPTLGMWQPHRAALLQRESPNSNIWSAVVSIPSKQTVYYRFLICCSVESGAKVIVRQWEVHLKPREIGRLDKSPIKKVEPEAFGVSSEGGEEYQTRIDRGWLTREMVVQLKLTNNAVSIFKPKYANRRVFIKISPVRLNKTGALPKTVADALEESLSSDTTDIEPALNTFTEVIAMNETDPRFEYQEQFGREYNPSVMLLYQCTILSPKDTAFLVDLFIYRSKCAEGEPPFHAGYCYLLPTAFHASEGAITVPLTSTKHQPLGQMTFEYLVVTPLPSFQCDLSVSYERYWNKVRAGLDVGHRGAGSSFKSEPKNCAEIRENTIASMKTAIDHGADYVEFDVQLSKDMVPIIYHDFHVCISLKRKKNLEAADMLEIPIKDLTLEQLHLLKIYHLTEGKSKNQKFFDEDLEEHQPFPTLQHCLEILDPKCGFNIEIKWTMQLKNESYELYNATDVNVYLDTILDVVLRHAGNRRIIFSCFNPDVCSIIRMKQNKYPVMFLTQGNTQKYDHYKDPRCWSINSAVQFANYSELLGVNVHTEDILREPSTVGVALNANLVIFCWGDDNADPDTIRYLKELGLHGVIYDKIYVYSGKEVVKESIFLLQARESQKALIQLTASEATADVPSAGPEKMIPDRILNVDQARLIMGDRSTATSLASLESRFSDYQKQATKNM